jgi:hypothetical protein
MNFLFKMFYLNKYHLSNGLNKGTNFPTPPKNIIYSVSVFIVLLLVRLTGGWCWFVLRDVLLSDCWWLVCSKRKVLLAGG